MHSVSEAETLEFFLFEVLPCTAPLLQRPFLDPSALKYVTERNDPIDVFDSYGNAKS